ncbi:MAG: hypothetical protein H6572_04355 [Lewinellaceae bacterium]|nr:hypothetical protein [Lewinellaceae bacterium]
MDKILIILAILICSGGCNNDSKTKNNGSKSWIKMAQKITISELSEELKKFKFGRTEYDFIGITSNGVDCIYFTYNNAFNIEFEAIIEEQAPYIEKLKEFARLNGINTYLTTYKNKSEYSSIQPAPVLVIEVHSDINKIVEVASNIQKLVFNNNNSTIYEVVP